MKYEYRYQERYKDVQIDVKAHTQKDLMRKVQAKRDSIDRQTIDGDMRLRDFCLSYLNTYKRQSVTASWLNDLCRMTDKMVDFIGNKPIGKIKPIEAQSFINSCAYMSDNTIAQFKTFVQQVFDEAKKNGATSYSFDLVAPKGKAPKQGRSLSQQEQTALLRAIQNHRGELFVSVLLYCGLRPSEACALIWKDIDMEKQLIYVNKSLKKDGTVGTTKTPFSVREVPIPMKLLPLLKKHRKSPFSYVFEQRNGLYTYNSMRVMWDSIKKATEKELGRPFNYRLYDLRHTYCTNLERAGVPINIASRLMGHSNIATTSRIYTHASEEAIEIARRCINAF